MTGFLYNTRGFGSFLPTACGHRPSMSVNALPDLRALERRPSMQSTDGCFENLRFARILSFKTKTTSWKRKTCKTKVIKTDHRAAQFKDYHRNTCFLLPWIWKIVNDFE